MREITYCLSCKKDTRNIDPRIVKTKNNKRVMSSKRSICNNKKSKFISQGSGLFDSLGLNTPQNRMKNALLLDNKIINMNNIIKTFLLAGDKFMPEMHLKQPQFVYSACDPFTRHKEIIKEFKRTGDTRLLYRNELDKACFKHDVAYAKYKDVENRLISDQKLTNSAYYIAGSPKYDGYQRGLASMVYKFFDSKVAPLDKKTMSSKGNAKHSSLERTKNNKTLAEELHKPVIKIFNKKKVYSHFRDNIWGVDLADMQ